MEATGALVAAKSAADPKAMADAQAKLDTVHKEMAALPKS